MWTYVQRTSLICQPDAIEVSELLLLQTSGCTSVIRQTLDEVHSDFGLDLDHACPSQEKRVLWQVLFASEISRQHLETQLLERELGVNLGPFLTFVAVYLRHQPTAARSFCTLSSGG